MSSAMVVYAAALRRASRGRSAPLRLATVDGCYTHTVDARPWCADVDTADITVLRRCTGPTLDIGCGPGRLAAALAQRGVPTLGVDVNQTAVRLARRRGVTTVTGSVFDLLPDEGRWQHLLLIDGNLGIGGDPVALLRRCAELITPNGQIMVEVEPPGTPTWDGPVTITGGRHTSDVFDWSVVAADRLPEQAAAAGLRLADQWTERRRWFACLTT
ncbi:SAM-dependent methyltransferase [Allocatelliglobosispora scoriae]|uniref:SAM-dependent methyltransferase n=1 Tax=Allocatelliglobosispora scoriae TaxID=643052 RepID=A0A841BLK3_9ACTN|nr:class I SAM-dependent methyltransferase [Allocatelliglobosispora scoriae]MBB5868079.1 SAM-dependent methyltransferase [Allocatelliglobosispora scoriae]